MMHTTWTNNQTSTADLPDGKSCLLKIAHDEGQWLVSDFLGLRYGVGETPEAALMDWLSGVREFAEWSKGERLGAALAAEVGAYRKFLETNVVEENNQ